MNTYLSLWAASTFPSSIPDPAGITPVMAELPIADRLMETLDNEWCRAIDAGDAKRAKVLKEQVAFLVKALDAKWDRGTQDILQHLDLQNRSISFV